MKGWPRYSVLLVPLLLLSLGSCSSSKSDKLQTELDQARSMLNGSLSSIEKNSAKTADDKHLGKYFVLSGPDLGRFNASLTDGLPDKQKRDLAYLYLSALLGKLHLSFLEMIADLISNTANKTDEGQGTFAVFTKFIPESLRTKENVEKNLETLNMIQKVVDNNFGTQICLQLGLQDAATCCARESNDPDCAKRAQGLLDKLLEKSPEFFDEGSSKVRDAQNKGLRNVATVSCFTSIVRSTSLSISVVGTTLEDLGGETGGATALAAMAVSMKDGFSFSAAIEKLQGASLFIDDLTNMTTKSCVDSGLIPADNPFTANLKTIKATLDEKINFMKGIGVSTEDATNKAVVALMTQQFGIRCNDQGKECCQYTDADCFSKYKDPLAALSDLTGDRSQLPPLPQ